MKPAPFDYASPDSLEATLSLLARHGSDAKLLAGGQSLIPLLNFRLARPKILLDLNRVSELDFIRAGEDGGLRIGAMTRQADLERDQLVADRAPLLREAVPFIAHEQIRNRGTVGGSLAHADPAAELPVLAVALGARLRLKGPSGERWLQARDFFVGLLTTALAAEEMVVEVAFPPRPADQGESFQEIARRHGDYALAGVAAVLRVDPAGICRQAGLVYLSVGDGPMVADRSAALLVDEKPDERLLDAVARQASDEEIEPSGDLHASAAFKRHLCRVLTRRALTSALRRARARHETDSL